jgi:hypothetical protein
LQYAAACSLGKQIRSPPLVSAENPCINLNMLPHAWKRKTILDCRNVILQYFYD